MVTFLKRQGNICQTKDIAMGARRIRREQRQVDMAESRRTNGMLKTAERNRRHKRLIESLKKCKPPYTPIIQSWLSAALNKPSRQITPEDVSALLKG
jgi:hypothetical protein